MIGEMWKKGREELRDCGRGGRDPAGDEKGERLMNEEIEWA
jgi:hypothetical protein